MNGKKTALALVMLPLLVWMGLAITYTGAQGGDLVLWRVGLAVALTFAVVWAIIQLPIKRSLTLCAAVLAATIGFWAMHQPTNDRPWAPVAAKAPWAEINGSQVKFHNVRNFRYGADGAVQQNWYSATYDANDIEQGYLALTRFGGVPGIAHVMVSFKFKNPQKGADGNQYLVMSAEIRREQGEEYHPVGGLFRQFELFYVVADERDALALRTHIHQDPTWLIPMNAGPQKTRAFFLDMVRRANQLRDKPEWYNSITNSCASNLAKHYEIINQINIPPDYRIVLPGFSGDLLAELDLLPQGMTADAALAKYRIDERARTLPLDANFSAQIRNFP